MATILYFFLLQLTTEHSVTVAQQEWRTWCNKGCVHLRSPHQKGESETQGCAFCPVRCCRTHLGQNDQISTKGAVSLGNS